MVKPFLTYNGGKAGNGTYQQIINHIPKCNVFIDAMVGNGGIFLNLKRPALTVINDVDAAVIDKYNCEGLTDKTNYVGQGEIRKENLDVQCLIDKYDCNSLYGVFFYFDPPYLKATRKNQKDLYKYEWAEDSHDNFLQRVLSLQSNCMISHYPCTIYNNVLIKANGWNYFDFQSMTRNGLATERIYMNYPKPSILQDFRYLGTDYIDRQRIKRKVQRFINKIANLPELERTAILSGIIDKNNYTAEQLITSVRADKF